MHLFKLKLLANIIPIAPYVMGKVGLNTYNTNLWLL